MLLPEASDVPEMRNVTAASQATELVVAPPSRVRSKLTGAPKTKLLGTSCTGWIFTRGTSLLLA